MSQENETENASEEAKQPRYRFKPSEVETDAIRGFIVGQFCTSDFPRSANSWLPENQEIAAWIYEAASVFGATGKMSEDFFLANSPDKVLQRGEAILADVISTGLDAAGIQKAFARFDTNAAAQDLGRKLIAYRKGQGISQLCEDFQKFVMMSANDATTAGTSDGDGSFKKLLQNLSETGVLHVNDSFEVPCLTEATGIKMNACELSLICARTSAGKSILARQLALHTSLKHGVVYHSLENGIPELLRNFSKAIGPELKNNLYSDKKDFAKDIAKRLQERKLYCYHAEQTLQNMLITAGMHVKKDNARMWLIDYASFIKVASDGRQKTQTENLAIATKALKSFAVKNNVAVGLVAQLNRLAEGQKPELSNLRDSGALEEDSQLIISIHMPHGRNDPRREIMVLKNSNGRIDSCKVEINLRSITFQPETV